MTLAYGKFEEKQGCLVFYIEIPARLWYNIFTVHNDGNIWTFFFNKIFSEGKIAKKQ